MLRAGRVGAPPTVQRGKAEKEKKRHATNPYAKSYDKHVETKRPSRKAAREHKVIRSGPRLTDRQRGPGRDAPRRPTYLPPRDSLGNLVWDGRRAGLGWYTNVKAAMANANPGACQIAKSGCTGGADAIDHKDDFATVQSGLARYEVCDGRNHFSAVYKDDALDSYNGGNTSNSAQPHLGGLQWSCTQCNSSKSGRKGVYENVPVWIMACPGSCGYTPRGTPAD